MCLPKNPGRPLSLWEGLCSPVNLHVTRHITRTNHFWNSWYRDNSNVIPKIYWGFPTSKPVSPLGHLLRPFQPSLRPSCHPLGVKSQQTSSMRKLGSSHVIIEDSIMTSPSQKSPTFSPINFENLGIFIFHVSLKWGMKSSNDAFSCCWTDYEVFIGWWWQFWMVGYVDLLA